MTHPLPQRPVAQPRPGAATLAGWLVAAVGVGPGAAQAADATLWVNGRSNPAQVGNHADFRYWGPASTEAGINKKSVNWDGYNRISTQNIHLRRALDCYCTGENWCYLAGHSAGDLMIGYTLALHGGSTRTVGNGSPGADGQCEALDGRTQTGWNIHWVSTAGGASGGSELANSGDWALDEPLVSDLKTTTARGLYNHNETRGLWFFRYAGAKGTLYSFLLPGQDDEAIAYHSSGGLSGTQGGSFCNPSDLFCKALTLGTAPAEGGRAKWAFQDVVLRDDKERYDHYTRNRWGGIVGPMRADVAATALPTGGPMTTAARAEQAARWQAKLQRAEQVRGAYRAATRYPHDARPLTEQVDQQHPFDPIEEWVPLAQAGPSGQVSPLGWRLKVAQDRLRAQGQESVGLRVSAQDAKGRPLPLQVTRAEAQALVPGMPPGAGPIVPLLFNDLGRDGDAWPGDGQWSLLFQPARQGFAGYEGAIRVELQVRSGSQQGRTWIDLTYTPTAPATWVGPIRSRLEAGSLVFRLPVQVEQAGRYVASGRVEDADGRPVALLSFNGPLAAGTQQIPLRLFGRLVHDLQPRFPLRLRDVDAFLLHEDRFPDRAPMAAWPGVLHQTAVHPLTAFSTAEWDSPERQRYLQRQDAEVQTARAALRLLAAGGTP